MKKAVYVSAKAPAPVGPYSQAIGLSNLLFCSGQIPLDASSGEMVRGPIQDQTRKVMENVGAVLESAGLSFEHILKTTIFLTDINHFSAMNEVYATYFKQAPPARSTVEVAALPRGAEVEIEVIAARN